MKRIWIKRAIIGSILIAIIVAGIGLAGYKWAKQYYYDELESTIINKYLEGRDAIGAISSYPRISTILNPTGCSRINGEDLNGKYVEVDLYSKRDVFLGRRYIEVKDLEQNGTMSFEVFFKLQEVGSYEVVIADKKEPADEIEWVPKDWTKPEIIAVTIITLLILM